VNSSASWVVEKCLDGLLTDDMEVMLEMFVVSKKLMGGGGTAAASSLKDLGDGGSFIVVFLRLHCTANMSM